MTVSVSYPGITSCPKDHQKSRTFGQDRASLDKKNMTYANKMSRAAKDTSSCVSNNNNQNYQYNPPRFLVRKRPAPKNSSVDDTINTDEDNNRSSNSDSSRDVPSPQRRQGDSSSLSGKTPVQISSTRVDCLSGSSTPHSSSVSSSCQIRREKIVYSSHLPHSSSKSQELKINRVSQNQNDIKSLGPRRGMTSSPKDPETTTVVQSHDISSAKDSPLTNSTNKTSSVVAATTIGSDGEDDTSTDSSQEDEVPQSTVQSYPTRCNPSPQVYLPTVATQLASAGFIQDAIDVFTEWIEMKAEPEDYRVYFNRCWCRYELEQYKEALDDANKVLHLNTTFSKGYYLKGKIMIEMKRFVEAETAFMTSYSLDGYPQGPLGNPTIQWIKKNIYFCLMDDGYDSYVADCIAKDHLSIDEARHFLDMGGFSEIVVQMVKKKSMQKCEEMKKTGKIYPRSWFKLQYNIAPLRKSRHESD